MRKAGILLGCVSFFVMVNHCKSSFKRRVKKQLKEIVHYITNTLYNPIAAKNILMSIEKAIDSLEGFPYRNRIYDPIEFSGLYRH